MLTALGLVSRVELAQRLGITQKAVVLVKSINKSRVLIKDWTKYATDLAIYDRLSAYYKGSDFY